MARVAVDPRTGGNGRHVGWRDAGLSARGHGLSARFDAERGNAPRAPPDHVVVGRLSGTSFTGSPKDIHGCGVHNRPFPVNSYKWFARGQSGRMYNCFNAACAVNVVLGASTDASQSTPVGWRSIFIVC